MSSIRSAIARTNLIASHTTSRLLSTSTTMSLSPCCLQVGSFDKGTPAGKMTKLDGKDTYVTGDTKSKSAILFIAVSVRGGGRGWVLDADRTWPLSYAIARRTSLVSPSTIRRSSPTSTPRVPALPSTSREYARSTPPPHLSLTIIFNPSPPHSDYFAGEDFVAQGMLEGKQVDIPAFIAKYNPRDKYGWKQSEAFIAEIKKQQPGAKIGAVGFCWGATSVLHLGSKEAGQNGVDAVAFAHPSIIEASE